MPFLALEPIGDFSNSPCVDLSVSCLDIASEVGLVAVVDIEGLSAAGLNSDSAEYGKSPGEEKLVMDEVTDEARDTRGLATDINTECGSDCCLGEVMDTGELDLGVWSCGELTLTLCCCWPGDII